MDWIFDCPSQSEHSSNLLIGIKWYEVARVEAAHSSEGAAHFAEPSIVMY